MDENCWPDDYERPTSFAPPCPYCGGPLEESTDKRADGWCDECEASFRDGKMLGIPGDED
jgi:hypothetical protein